MIKKQFDNIIIIPSTTEEHLITKLKEITKAYTIINISYSVVVYPGLQEGYSVLLLVNKK